MGVLELQCGMATGVMHHECNALRCIVRQPQNLHMADTVN